MTLGTIMTARGRGDDEPSQLRVTLTIFTLGSIMPTRSHRLEARGLLRARPLALSLSLACISPLSIPLSVALSVALADPSPTTTPTLTAPSSPSVTSEGATLRGSSELNVSPESTSSPQGEPTAPREATERLVAEALTALRTASPELKLTQRVSSLSPNLILKMNLSLEGRGGREKAKRFVERFKGLWSGLDVEVSDASTRRFKTYATLKASVQGAPVFNQDARLMIDQEGRAQQLSSALSAIFERRDAQISEGQAVRVALSHLNLPLDAPHLTRLGYIVHAGVATAAYEVQAGGLPAQSHPVVLIDAVEGVVLSVQDRVRR